AADLATDVTKAITEMVSSTADALREPGRAWQAVRETAEGLSEVVWAGLTPAPASPLNGPTGPHRRVAWIRTRLADYKLIKNRVGGTVNDVVLATVAGALGQWMRQRGARTEGLVIRAGVPVSVRADSEHNQLGNRVTMMAAPLPVYCDDPLERLEIVRAAMRDLKDSKQALGAQIIVGLERFAPPTLFAQASRLHFSPMLVNLIVTNVPGPQFPLFLMGREMLEMAPVGFIVDGFRLIVALVSYNGYLTFGLLGDYDSMPDLDFLGAAVESTLADLVAASQAK
ncbi:MAG TPA: WS/DGAT domain-containing protein, partial [Candidatus Acidoferrales bacterium]|nr:WS/DGAT domain-containing protein [Candidatus Acidoferrales bacterium]